MVNNAAAFIYGSVEETTYEQWHKVWDVNVVGQAQMVKVALPELRKAGGGSVVNIASQSRLAHRAGQLRAVQLVEGRRAATHALLGDGLGEGSCTRERGGAPGRFGRRPSMRASARSA